MEKITIVCNVPEHGEFKQILRSHMNGHGCNKCSYILRGKNRLKKVEEFTEEANELFNNSYDYSEFNYLNRKTKGLIICKTCGYRFCMSPSYHLNHRMRLPKM